MSHGFCLTHIGCLEEHSSRWPELGWSHWNGESIYIQAIITDSIIEPQAYGEAITNWNQAIGQRFLILPNEAPGQIIFYEKDKDEWPFNVIEWQIDGSEAAALAFIYDKHGNMINTHAGQYSKVAIYLRKDIIKLTIYPLVATILSFLSIA